MIPWQNPFALCDPITDETFMITDFEHEDPANGVSDIKASGFVAVHEEQSEDDFFGTIPIFIRQKIQAVAIYLFVMCMETVLMVI